MILHTLVKNESKKVAESDKLISENQQNRSLEGDYYPHKPLHIPHQT